jgi:hypothetical protein
MKTPRRLLLFATLLLILMSTACGTGGPGGTPGAPTPSSETQMPSTTETQTTATMEATATAGGPTETPGGPTATAGGPTATGPASVIPVELICWFCVQQVPHVIVAIPEKATVEVLTSSSGVTCDSVERVEGKQLVLCRGPKQSGSIAFDLKVCADGNCSERHVVAIDCSATAVPTPTDTPTLTPTPTATSTPTATAGGTVATATVAANATSTATSVTVVLTLTRPAATPTPTP